MITEDFEIIGGKQLSGTAVTNTSKNGALALICASLINKKPTTLKGVPDIEEIKRLSEILESIGVAIDWLDKRTIKITPPLKYKMENINRESASKVRSILMIIGPLTHEEHNFAIPHAGGCKMGERTIAAHRYALEELGVGISTTDDEYKISSNKLSPADITLYEASDTATINTLLAAARIPGKTTLRFATPNYQVQDVCYYLEHLGIQIEGIGTHILTVHGTKEIAKEIEWSVSEDPIESIMFISAAVTTNSKLKIERCPIDFLRLELLKLSKMGLEYKMSEPYLSENNKTNLVDIEILPSKLTALTDKIHAQPYPGINTDNLPFFVPIATRAEGMTKILDWMWENRAIYFTELNRLGANITLTDPHRVFIQGPTPLSGAQIVCPPALRPSMIILVAMLAAEGKSILRNVYSIRRGYEDIVERLNDLGAEIRELS